MAKNNISTINRKLDKTWINSVFQKIENSNLPYISTETITCLKKYKRKNHTLDDTKNVWKSLLIDAIAILKINDGREKIYDELLKGEILTKDKFDKIRKTSSFGIDELADYLDDFISFESVLYGTEKHYRDHVDHVFQVWAVGIQLLNNEIKLNDDFKVERSSEYHFNISINKDVKISKSELWGMWTLISLCHDLGYPVEKSSEINKQTKKIISHFGSIHFTELDYSFNVLNTFLVENFLDIISSKVYKHSIYKEDTSNTTKGIEEEIKKHENIENEKNSNDNEMIERELPEFSCTTFIQTKYRDKLSKSLEDYKHGIFSSLLLFKNLTYFLETDYYVGNEKLKAEDARQFYIRKEILRSIAGHTCPKMYHIELNTLGFLLILCDELQEWNRPNFESLVTGSRGIEPKVKILNLVFNTTEQHIHIEMKYTTENKESSYEEYLIRSKFKNIHYLLRSAVNDMKRKIIFQWDIYVNINTYIFTFDSKENSFEQLKVKKISANKKLIDFDLYD